jgi:hypothetical protein
VDNRNDDLPSLLRVLRGGNNTTTVQINAGGIGVWICCTVLIAVCAVSVSSSADRAKDVARQDQEIRDLRDDVQALNDYLSAIYMQAPHLKPKEPEQ